MIRTELTPEEVAAIVEDYFHRRGDYSARVTPYDFGPAFFTVRHQQPVQLPRVNSAGKCETGDGR